MDVSQSHYSHLHPVLWLFIILQVVLFAPRLNSDGAFYYEYLRSWTLQNDLNFHDEREFFTWEWVPVLKDFLPGDWEKTGYPPNIFSFGPALVWLPFFLIGHLAVLMLNALGASVSTTGYGALHRFLPMLSSVFAGLLTLFILDRTGREAGFHPNDRRLALFMFLGASHLPAFLFVTPAFAHSFSVLFTSAFLLLWYKSGRSVFTSPQYALFGIVSGMAVMARWQNLFCLILPALDIAHEVLQKKSLKQLSESLRKWVIFSVSLVLTMLPQLLVTKALYGKWITDPQGDGGMRWFSPAFKIVFFDGVKGLFSVNPILLPAMVALPFLWKRNKRMTLGLTLLVISQSYINAVRRDWAGVGFGMRRFLNLAPGFALGLMVLFALTRTPSRRWLRVFFTGTGIALIAWNLLLMAQYYLSPLGAPWIEMSFSQMIRTQFTQSPRLLMELCQSSLIVNGLLGDYSGLVLGVLAVLLVGVLFHRLSRAEVWFQNLWSRKAKQSIIVLSACWVIVAGWLLMSMDAARVFHIVDIYQPGYFAEMEQLRLNPVSGFQGFSGGLKFGPGIGWTSVRYKAEYDRNRFLAPGKMEPGGDSVFREDTRVKWIFNEPVRVAQVDIISGVTGSSILQPEQLVGEIVLTDLDGDSIRLPVEYRKHIGCSHEYPPENGDLIKRNWPALRPIESDIVDTKARYLLPGPIMLKAVTIRFENLSVEWFVRGIAFLDACPDFESADLKDAGEPQGG